MIERLITKREAANILGVSTRTIENYVYERKIPFLRIGGLTKFRESDLERWLNHKSFTPRKEVFNG